MFMLSLILVCHSCEGARMAHTSGTAAPKLYLRTFESHLYKYSENCTYLYILDWSYFLIQCQWFNVTTQLLLWLPYVFNRPNFVCNRPVTIEAVLILTHRDGAEQNNSASNMQSLAVAPPPFPLALSALPVISAKSWRCWSAPGRSSGFHPRGARPLPGLLSASPPCQRRPVSGDEAPSSAEPYWVVSESRREMPVRVSGPLMERCQRQSRRLCCRHQRRAIW